MISQLGASGNLESTTKPASTKARRDVVVFNSTQSDQAWSARRAAEERVAANDEDLDSYFEAFPEQASMSVSHLVSFLKCLSLDFAHFCSHYQ